MTNYIDMSYNAQVNDLSALPKGGNILQRYKVKSSLQVDRGRWYVQCRIYDTDTDECFQRKRSTGLKADRNKRKAEAMIPDVISQIMVEFNKPSIKAEPTVGEYINIWLDKRRKSTRESTMYSYQLYADKYFLPTLGNVPIRKLTYRSVQSFYDKLATEHKSNSLRKYNCVLKGALDEAVRDEIIKANPADRVEFPKQDKFEGSAYTAEQMFALLRAVQGVGEPLQACVVLAGCYGLRREEALGLRWKDIDFENGCLHICNTVTKAGNKVVEAERTKTKKSQRDIPLVDSTIDYLKFLKEEQISNGLKLDRVVRKPDGTYPTPDYITHAFTKLLKKAGLPHIRFHDLRHTAATLLSASGVKPKQISEFLGHESVLTTLDIYADVYDTEKAETSDAMSAIYKSSALCYAFCYASPPDMLHSDKETKSKSSQK